MQHLEPPFQVLFVMQVQSLCITILHKKTIMEFSYQQQDIQCCINGHSPLDYHAACSIPNN